MKITKFVHSCLLVETTDHSALFDPGVWSESAFEITKFEQLDDILITHEHADHMSVPFIQKLVAKFPHVRITTTAQAVDQLTQENIKASSTAPEGVKLFNAPHEGHQPFMTPPEQAGFHYLDLVSHPGDSHSFTETKMILALPITAPWGSTLAAVDLAIKLRPTYIVPVHDWLWRDEVRLMMYERLEQLFKENGVTFLKLENTKAVEIEEPE
jgi:L-ascorbate metabolism protein UlaG (beta-lactamase superfamily)